MSKRVAYLYIAAAACLWGIISLFIRHLYAAGFTPTQVVSIRAISATFFLLLYALYKDMKSLSIKPADSRYFVGTGIISVVFFNWCMFNAIQETSVSVATILLYTAPAFVTLLSRVLFREALTSRKIIALISTLLGCSFVVGFLPSANESISSYGLVLGLGSGLFYALYSIFGKFALQKYSSLTVSVYTFLFAAVAVTPFSGLWKVMPLFSGPSVWLYIIGLGFLSTTLAYLLYTKGLERIESSRASIIASLEPVVASFMGYLVFKEQLELWQYVGIVMVIAAVIIVQEPATKAKAKEDVPTNSSY